MTQRKPFSVGNMLRCGLAVVGLSVVFSVTLNAQLTEPVYSVPTADVASLGEFGEVPVSHFTGVPDVSIPLYTIQVGNFSWPIGVAYHLSSVRPNEQPGSTGLGWAPMWDACITRNVRGVPDEKKLSSGAEPGYYGNRNRDISLSSTTLYDATMNHLEGAGWYEMSADEFSFNVAGLSGNFYIGEDGQWIVVSDQAVKVEFNPQTDFLSVNDLTGRIERINNWPHRNECQRFFGGFTLVGPDGTRYKFGGKWATDFSADYYARNNNDIIATAWHITRIDTPDGHSVIFGYEQTLNNLPIMVDLRYVTGYRFRSGTGIPQGEASTFIQGRRAYSGFLLYPSILKTITTENEVAQFTWAPDLEYGDMYLHFAGEALYWESTENMSEHLYTPGADDQTAQFRDLLPNTAGTGSSVQQRRQSISEALRHMVLHRIAISTVNGNGDPVGQRSYYFDYTGKNRRKLKSIVTRGGVPELKYESIFGGGMVITRLVIPEAPMADVGKLPTWHFRYNVEDIMPKGYVFPRTDLWGYWQGEVKSPSRCYVPQEEDDYSPAPLKYSKAETLRAVYWPTGGSTEFAYERNTYSRRLTGDRLEIEDTTGISGGLRVSSVTVKDTDGHIEYQTRYHYTDVLPSVSSSGPSSGISEGIPIVLKAYSYTDVNGPGSMYVYSESGFKGSASRNNTPDVGYSSVIEERMNESGQSLGYIRYRYSNFDYDIWNDMHMDSSASYVVNASSNGVGVPYTSLSSERGKLLSKEWFDNSGTPLRKEATRYSRVADSTALTATQQALFIRTVDATGHTAVSSAYIAWLTGTRLFKYLPEKTVVEEYTPSGTRTEAFSFKSWNDDGLPVKDSTKRSDGLWNITKTVYASEMSQYEWMRNKWMLAYPSSITSYTTDASGVVVDGSSRTVTGVYSAAGVGNNIPYLSKVTKQGKDVYEVLLAENHGKPVDIMVNGLRSQLAWSFGGQRLSRVADNCTPTEAGTLPATSSKRSPVHDSPVRRFFYKDNRFLEREENSTGLLVTYGYDVWDRLNAKAIDLPTDTIRAIPSLQMADTLLEKYSYKMEAPIPAVDLEIQRTTSTDFEPVIPTDPNEPERVQEQRELFPETGYAYTVDMKYINASYHELIPENKCLINVTDTLTVSVSANNFVYYRGDGGDPLPTGQHPLNVYLTRTLTAAGVQITEPAFRLPLLLDSSTLTVCPYESMPAGANVPMVISNGVLIVTLPPGQYLLSYLGISEDEMGEYVGPHDRGGTKGLRGPLDPEEPEDPDDPGIPDNPDEPMMGILNYPSFTMRLECLPLLDEEEIEEEEDSRTYNSITTSVSRDGTWSNTSNSDSYLDGLGRGVMRVLSEASPVNGGDIVTLQEYDGWGRPSNQWLPTNVNLSTGQVHSPNIVKTKAGLLYGTTEEPYSYPVYEASMLGRVTAQYGPGKEWHFANKNTATEYLTNGSGLACRQFTVSAVANPGGNDNLWNVSAAGYYGAGTLQILRITDEDGRTRLEFKDMQGKTVLSRSLIAAGGGTYQNLDTYYIYDAVGNLLVVLPPKASESISSDVQSVSSAVLSGLCYQYRYDGRDRSTVKKLPGASSVYYVYDNADRLVLMQDGNNRQKGQSIFTLYDVLGRVVITGMCTNTISINANGSSTATGYLADAIVKATYGGSTAAIKGYNVTGITLGNPAPLTVTWYDRYDFISDVLGLTSIYATSAPRYSEELTNTTGLMTGTWSVLLGDQTVLPLVMQGSGIWSISRYDLFGRVARVVANDHNGNITATDNDYTHRGSIRRSYVMHVPSSGDAFVEEYINTFDGEERPLARNHVLTGRPAVNLETNTYDAIGRLLSVAKGGNNNLTQQFTYNTRSWITKIGGNLFTESLFYNSVPTGATAQWGGNIASLEWGMGIYDVAPTVGWDMTYDGINRLTGIQGRRGGAIFAGETSSYTYDSMGNLLSKSNFTASGTDNITFNVPTDGNVLTGETYDANGNRTTETASGISSITYNTLNLPESVTVDTLTVHYLYSAAGTKLKESSTDYSGNLIYKNGTLHKILTGGGYIETSDSLVALLSSPVYRFFLTDHLGSVRVVADAQGRVLQQNNQLPYGEDYAPVYAAGHSMTSGGGNIPPGEEIGEEPLGGVGTVGLNVLGDPIEDDGEELGNIPTLEPSTLYRSFNPYRFCGKEQMTSSGFYGFGARWYSPKTGRWTTQDPLSEKYYSISPYAYCAGNPVNIVDPDGADWYTNNETGYYTWFEGNEEIEGYTYYGGKGSLLGEAETMINELFEEMNKNEDSDNQKGLYINGFTLAIRDNKTQGCTGGKSILGLFGEFIFNKGPEYSVFLEDHPYTEDLKNNMHIRNSQDKIIASKSGYYITSREWGPKDVPNTDIFSEQFMGSFTYYGKRNKENTVLHNVVFDSKSLYSLLYHLPFIKNKERSQTNHFGNTYQFYIWDTKL